MFSSGLVCSVHVWQVFFSILHISRSFLNILAQSTCESVDPDVWDVLVPMLLFYFILLGSHPLLEGKFVKWVVAILI